MLALSIGIGSLALLPCIPILPGLTSLMALAVALLAFFRAARPQWMTVLAIVVAAMGYAVALVQLLAVFLAAGGVSP